MKVIALAVFALAVFGANADVASDVSSALNKILERIPEPLVDIHDKNYNLDLTIEKLDFDINDLELKGVNNMDIVTMDYDESTGRLDYVLDFPAINFNFDFALILSGLVAVENRPTIRMDLSDMKISGYAVVDSSASPSQLTDFSVLITFDGAKFELSKLLNDEAMTESISKLLNENFVESFNTLSKDLEPFVSPIVQSITNIILRRV